MVRVPGGEINVFYPGFEHIKPIQLGDYLMNRFEVTNIEFKRFADAGGYRRRDLLDYRFVEDGRMIPWGEAMARVTDRAGRPGPSTSEAWGYPPGAATQPAAGRRWY